MDVKPLQFSCQVNPHTEAHSVVNLVKLFRFLAPTHHCNAFQCAVNIQCWSKIQITGEFSHNLELQTYEDHILAQHMHCNMYNICNMAI